MLIMMCALKLLSIKIIRQANLLILNQKSSLGAIMDNKCYKLGGSC
jgi:hypothetical protein